MYLVIIITLAVIAPLVTTVVQGVTTDWDAGLVVIAGQQWVFWGVGIRLFTAGLSQALRPQFTMKKILRIDAPGATQLVGELGYANIGMGAAGILSYFFPDWAPAAALAGGLFLLLAGIRHIAKPNKNAKEWIALATDLLIAVIVLVYVGWVLVTGPA
ncbi:DUF6790 family protein [Agromyces laixinhei]|uniref:DUF6790 family protein n=1 Tax=Agromyces laixinhei TaxID=2585717 RepID=UPI0012ED1849|nr:DUF6790 family protein [Agromyces laixinhei]